MNRCPKCGGDAYVIDSGKVTVKLECDKCKVTWRTPAKTCPKCRKPNGFAVSGMCITCYGDRMARK